MKNVLIISVGEDAGALWELEFSDEAKIDIDEIKKAAVAIVGEKPKREERRS